MRKNLPPIDINLVTHNDVLTQNSDILHSNPLPNHTVPSHNATVEPGMGLDSRALEDRTTLDTDPIFNDDVRANGNIGSDSAVTPNHGTRVLKVRGIVIRWH